MKSIYDAILPVLQTKLVIEETTDAIQTACELFRKSPEFTETERRLAELRAKRESKTTRKPVTLPTAENQTRSGGLIQRPRSRRRPKDWLGEAIKLLQSNPELSDRQIAKQIGVAPSTLARDATFQRAAKIARELHPVHRGFMANNGRVEVVAPEDVEAE